METAVLKPAEILEASHGVAEAKASGSFSKLAILGFLAGAFIAFAGSGSNMAAFNLLADPETYGLGRLVAGMVFPIGLMLVVLCGAELFTGNMLMIGAVCRRRITTQSMLRNWLIVYIFNFIGSVTIAWAVYQSGLLHSGADLLGAVTVKIAAGKASLDFGNAVILGVLCNWLVCLAVWMASASASMAGKILAIFFPISLFVISGFEHSIANMYFLTAGLFAKSIPGMTEAALNIGVAQQALDGLNWGGILVNNLLPVTIGNIIGGCVFVALAYLLAFYKKKA